MLDKLFESTTIPVLEQVISFTETRHSILAGNLANLDTPGYQVRDLSPAAFESRLKRAIVDRDESHVPISQEDLARPSPDAAGRESGNLEDFLYHDQSTGNLESQVMAISKNQLEHNLALSIMTNQFRLLQAAISEKV